MRPWGTQVPKNGYAYFVPQWQFWWHVARQFHAFARISPQTEIGYNTHF
jgi:hypothetical protein